ncbi:hypothetical protein CRUP_038649, partial [Coryphaenoides rupestris]
KPVSLQPGVGGLPVDTCRCGPGWHEHSGSCSFCHCVWRGVEEAWRGRGDPHQVLQLLQRGHHGAGLLDHVV